MSRVELLSPAGDAQRLRLALEFGADAVYVGGSAFTMRTNPANFDADALKAAVELTHSKGKKLYLTCNTLPRNNELEQLPDFLKYAQDIGVDAFIIAGMGVIRAAKKYAPDVDIHVSTQAGIVNYSDAAAYYELGASRVVTARELSLDEIKTIRDKCPPQLQIEAFVHGAMCMSFSGRCVLSDYLTGRDANRGECAQPCRWKYSVVEEKRPGEYFPVNEEENGTYIFNSRDLCMIEHIPQLVSAGIDSFKIEGRAKSEYYTAAVTHAYRAALDEYYSSSAGAEFRPSKWIIDEVDKISHRAYTTGFYFGPIEKGQVTDNGGYERSWEVCALFMSASSGRITVAQRNRFFEGEELEVLEPFKKPYTVTVKELYCETDGEKTSAANKAAAVYSFSCDKSVGNNAMFRRKCV